MISVGIENMQTSEGHSAMIHMDHHRLHMKAPQPPSSSKLLNVFWKSNHQMPSIEHHVLVYLTFLLGDLNDDRKFIFQKYFIPIIGIGALPSCPKWYHLWNTKTLNMILIQYNDNKLTSELSQYKS